jgi:hypothetical protein
MGKLKDQIEQLKTGLSCYVYFIHDFDIRKYNPSWSLKRITNNKYHLFINNVIYKNHYCLPHDSIEDILSIIDNNKSMALLNIRNEGDYLKMICEQILQGNEIYYDFNTIY